MSFWKDYTPLEQLCLVGALVSGPLAAYGAFTLSNSILGESLGDMPTLIGGTFLIFVPTMMGRGVEDMRRPRLDQRRRENEDYIRKLNSN